MKNDILPMGVLAVMFLLLFVLSETLYHVCKVKVEYTRKLTHIGTGIICLLFPVLLKNQWSVFVLCVSFALLLLLSIKLDLLKSIHAIDRRSIGGMAYPAAVYLCFLCWANLNSGYIFYYLPLTILAVCDPLAALSGKRWPRGPYVILGAKKTLLGSVVFFTAAILLGLLLWILILRLSLDIQQLMIIIVIALATTLAEAFSRDGYDNLTVPLTAIVCLYIFAR